MSLTKLYKPSKTALRQLFNRQLFRICVLSSNGEMAPNSAVSTCMDSIGRLEAVNSINIMDREYRKANFLKQEVKNHVALTVVDLIKESTPISYTSVIEIAHTAYWI